MPNSRSTEDLVIPLCTCRNSARVTQVGEPTSACAGAAVTASGAASAAVATRPRRILFIGLLPFVVTLGCSGCRDGSRRGGDQAEACARGRVALALAECATRM